MSGEVRCRRWLSVTRPASFAREKPGSRAVHRDGAQRPRPRRCRSQLSLHLPVSVQSRESRAAYGASGLRRPCGSPGHCADCIQGAGKHSVQVIVGHEHCTFMLSLGK